MYYRIIEYSKTGFIGGYFLFPSIGHSLLFFTDFHRDVMDRIENSRIRQVTGYILVHRHKSNLYIKFKPLKIPALRDYNRRLYR